MQAQNDVIYTHFMFNKMNYNAAFTGSAGVPDVAAIYRNQWWKGIDGAPTTINVFGHFPFLDERNGIGLSITSDKIGFYETLAADLSYAYHIEIDRKNQLSFGLSGRFESTRINWLMAEGVDMADMVIGQTPESRVAPNFGFGAYYKNDKFYAGLSVPRLLKDSKYTDGAEFNLGLNTYYLMGGINFEINDYVELYPNILVSYNPSAPFELDLNVNVLVLQSIWLGGSYRLGDSFDIIAQYYFKNNGLRIGGAYDFTLSPLNQKTAGSFELIVGFTLPCENCDIIHPRFL